MFDTARINTQKRISWNLFPAAAKALIEEYRIQDDLMIIDVCSPQEFKERHLENAINSDFLSRSFKDRLKTLDKDKIYLVYCKVGGRSKLAQRTMQKIGFKKVYNLVGGTLLWEEEGMSFASGATAHRFVLCPIFMSALIIVKTRKMLTAGSRSLARTITTVRSFGEKFGIRLPVSATPRSGGCGKFNSATRSEQGIMRNH